jgi:hypothetical protein
VLLRGKREVHPAELCRNVLDLARAHFGQDAAPAAGGAVRVGELTYVHREGDPPFVLVPVCDTCGTNEVDQFPLEEWLVDGAPVLAQSRATCRDCRFLQIGALSGPLGLDGLASFDPDPDLGHRTDPPALRSPSRPTAIALPGAVEPTAARHPRSERLVVAAACVLLVLGVLVATTQQLVLWDGALGRGLGTAGALAALALAGTGVRRSLHRPRPRSASGTAWSAGRTAPH